MKKCCLVFVSLLFYCLINITTVKAYTKDYPLSQINLAYNNINIKNTSVEQDGMYSEGSTEKEVCNNTGNEKEMNLYREKTEVVEVFSAKENKIYLTKEDIDLMSQIVYAESKGEPYEGKVAVASVILNRVSHPSFPKTVKEVIIQKNAFSCVKDGKIYVKPDESCYNAVMEAIKGSDPTGNAVFFYNPRIATSSWMKNVSKTNVKSIGNHVFFEVIK